MSSQPCWSAGGRNAPEETNRRNWPPNCAWIAPEQPTPDWHGQAPADRAQPVERGGLAASCDLALDLAPEQVEHLGDHDHRRHAMSAQRIEDDPRTPTADVQHVRPDRQRIEQADRLLEQVRQRQDRHDAVLHRGHDPVERFDRGEDIVVGEHHALGRTRGPGREHELEQVLRRGRWPARRPAPPSRPGTTRPARPTRVSTVVVGNRSRRASRGSGASRPVPRIRCRAPDAPTDHLDRVGRHPQVERDEHQAGPHRPEVGRRQLRRRGRPGQQAVAGLEAERAQPPGGQARAAIELAEAPGRGRSVVAAQAQRRPIAVPGDGVLEQVDQGAGHDMSVPREMTTVAPQPHRNTWRMSPRHDHPAMDPVRLGHACRALRIRRRWRQEDLAGRAKVSRSTISRLERGRLGAITVSKLRRVTEALEADLDVRVRWNGESLDRLLDHAHAVLVEVVVDRLKSAGWEVEVEVSFAIGGERGSIDVAAYHRDRGIVLVVEVKSVVPDSQATIHGLDRKARLAPQVAKARGWACRGVARLLVIGDSSTSRRRISQLGSTYGVAFPMVGRAMLGWLRQPVGPASGLVFLPFARPGSARSVTTGVQRIRTSSRASGDTNRAPRARMGRLDRTGDANAHTARE